MPFVSLKVLKTGITKEQKQQIVREFTDTLVRVLDKKPEHTHITIEEIDLENWGFMGELTSDLVARAAADAAKRG